MTGMHLCSWSIVWCFQPPSSGSNRTLSGPPNTEEARRLLALWDAMEKSVVWGPFVDAAAKGKPDVLVKLSHAFVWL